MSYKPKEDVLETIVRIILAAHRRSEIQDMTNKKQKRQLSRLLDDMCEAAMVSSPSTIVPWFLMASWLYYHRDISIISDGLYDQLAKDMLSKWDSITHWHKHLITSDNLKAGTLYSLTESDYPLRTRCAAAYLVYRELGEIIDVDALS